MDKLQDMSEELEAAYREMAQDEVQESEALEWTEATLGDVKDEPQVSPDERYGCEPF
jgi:hypothetical protein